MKKRFGMMALFALMILCSVATSALAADKTPQVIWCSGNSTLYFTNDETVYAADDTYDGQTVTQVWSGNEVTATGTSQPGWNADDIREAVQLVMFDASFEDVRPTSCY